MRVYYFPDWVFSALSAQGKNRSDVLCDEVVTSILSLDDVAFVSVMNQRICDILPKSLVETFLRDHGGPDTFWPRCEFNRNTIDGKEKHLPGLWDRIQNIQVNGCPDVWNPGVSNLTCEMMDEDTLVFTNMRPIGTPPPDGMASVSLERKITLLERVMEEIYPFVTFQDLAQTPLMRDWLISKQIEQKPALNAAA
jgi:hypothetical protein